MMKSEEKEELLDRSYNILVAKRIEGILVSEVLTPEARCLLELAKTAQINKSLPSKKEISARYIECLKESQ